MKVFILSSDHDEDIRGNLYQNIDTWGHEIWINQENHSHNRIDEALKWADVIIATLSDNSLRDYSIMSVWYRMIASAVHHNKCLIALKIDAVQIPSNLQHLDWITMTPDNSETVSQLETRLSQNLIDSWAPTQPIPLEDPYQDYLTGLYEEIEAELNFLLVSTGQSGSQNAKPVMSQTFSDDEGVLKNFQHGFDKHDGRVMLLAEEGAGKTLTLLTFLRDAILARLEDMEQPVPVMVRVRRWNVNKATRLEYWLAAQCNLSPGAIRELVDAGEALLIFDGLDELARRHIKFNKHDDSYIDPRKLFLQILPDNCRIIVSCTTNDYEQVGRNIPLNATISLDQLSDEQIQEYLDFHEDTRALWTIIAADENLLETCRFPFFLSMLASGFSASPERLGALKGKSPGELRDSIFESYVTQRYQQQATAYNGKAPFSLQLVFSILGLVAKRGVVRYGTGQAAMVQVNEPYWDDLLIIDELRFGFLGDESPYGGEFLAFTEELHLVKRPKKGIGSCTFIHTIVRDLLVMRQCLPIKDKVDSYAMESLSRVSDERKYEVFVEVLSGKFAPNFRLQAFEVLDADNSLMALKALIKLSTLLTDDEYFTPRITLSIESRLNALSDAVLQKLITEIDSTHYRAVIQKMLDNRNAGAATV